MTKSIMQEDRSKCFICGSMRDIEEHHCWTAFNRKHSTEDGLVVSLCRRCHADLHDHGTMYRELKAEAQRKWMKYYGKTKEDFIKRYGKAAE